LGISDEPLKLVWSDSTATEPEAGRGVVDLSGRTLEKQVLATSFNPAPKVGEEIIWSAQAGTPHGAKPLETSYEERMLSGFQRGDQIQFASLSLDEVSAQPEETSFTARVFEASQAQAAPLAFAEPSGFDQADKRVLTLTYDESAVYLW